MLSTTPYTILQSLFHMKAHNCTKQYSGALVCNISTDNEKNRKNERMNDKRERKREPSVRIGISAKDRTNLVRERENDRHRKYVCLLSSNQILLLSAEAATTITTRANRR